MTIGIESSSRPVYKTLAWRPARRQVLASDEAGLKAIERFLAQNAEQNAESIELYVLGRASRVNALKLPEAAEFEVRPDERGFQEYLSSSLLAAPMAASLYVAGSQSFLSSVERLARHCNFADAAIQAELAGSGARDAQCAHCKSIFHDIDYRAFDCPRCDVTLIVRDHYSRRLGAYQAVVLHPADPNLPKLRGERLW